MESPAPIQLIVYSVSDLIAAKKIFDRFLGTEPEVVQDVMETALGLLVARLKDADGNFLGLRQASE